MSFDQAKAYLEQRGSVVESWSSMSHLPRCR